MVRRVWAVARKRMAVDDGLVLEGDVGNLFRYCKDDMEVRAVEKLGFALEDPVGAGQRLALGTVTIRAGVVTGPLEAAMITLFEMAAQRGSAAKLDRLHDAEMRTRQGPVLLTVGLAVAAEDVGDFQLRTVHRSGARTAVAGQGLPQGPPDAEADRADWWSSTL